MSDSSGHKGKCRWLSYVQAFVWAYEQGELLSGINGGIAVSKRGAITADAAGSGNPPVVVLCSPHPDDEILTGALPLRLRQELGARVINLAVTLGSNRSRQAARRKELEEACAVAGFECRQLPVPPGFDLKRGAEGADWPAAIEALAAILAAIGPDLVFLPHAEDHHPAHLATHALATTALARVTGGGTTIRAVETEYWRPMAAPNLLVGLSEEDLARQLEALACHRGEIERNPYHLTQPARMMDTVRRGAELVKGLNSARPGFLFGELYRVSRWEQGQEMAVSLEPGWLGPDHELAGIVA